jgi:hypothetical protein
MIELILNLLAQSRGYHESCDQSCATSALIDGHNHTEPDLEELKVLEDKLLAAYPIYLRKLVEHRLLYAVYVFISLDVFLVRHSPFLPAVSHFSPEDKFGYDQGYAYIVILLGFVNQIQCHVWPNRPRFIRLFTTPNTVEVRSMIAVLEVGAFSRIPPSNLLPTGILA